MRRRWRTSELHAALCRRVSQLPGTGAESEQLLGAITAALETEASYREAKDILRAADLELLPDSNLHVKSDLAKIHAGKALSPILLVRGNAGNGARLQIADGYHRVCASYMTDENTAIPCRLVSWQA